MSWHWIFFINVPFGILSIALLQKNLKENFEKVKHKIDYLGTAILAFTILSFLVGVLLNKKILFLTCILFAVIFYFIEKKAEEPIMPFNIFTKEFTVINLIAFLVSGILIGVEGYMPIYMQSILGYGATVSGLSMAPMSIAWLMSAFILSKAIPKYGQKIVMIAANLIITSCSILLFLLKLNSPLFKLIPIVCIMGFGFGFVFTTVTVAVQESVGYSERGAATAVNSLLRTLGQTIGVTVFGSELNLRTVKYFSKLGIVIKDTNNLSSPENLAKGVTEAHIKTALHSGVHGIYFLLVLAGLVCLILAFLLSNNLKENKAA